MRRLFSVLGSVNALAAYAAMSVVSVETPASIHLHVGACRTTMRTQTVIR